MRRLKESSGGALLVPLSVHLILHPSCDLDRGKVCLGLLGLGGDIFGQSQPHLKNVAVWEQVLNL